MEQKKALVESRGVRQNIDEASHALQDCLEVLRLANQVHDLLAKKNHYAALRALDELQNVHLQSVTQYSISDMIQKSVPATQKAIAEAVMADLNTWLYRVRETSQYLGELSFYHTDLRKNRQAERAEKTPYLSQFKFNSAIELVSDEDFEYDLLNSEEVQVDFTPLFEALHIHESLGQMDKFRAEYAATRRRQKELLLPPSISLVDDDMANLHTLLEDIAGFAIVERATMKRVPDLRSTVDVSQPTEFGSSNEISSLTFHIDRRALGLAMSDSGLTDRKGLACCRQRRACAESEEPDFPIQPDYGQLQLPHRRHQ